MQPAGRGLAGPVMRYQRHGGIDQALPETKYCEAFGSAMVSRLQVPCHLVQSKEVKMEPNDALRVFHTEDYHEAVLKGEVLGEGMRGREGGREGGRGEGVGGGGERLVGGMEEEGEGVGRSGVA